MRRKAKVPGSARPNCPVFRDYDTTYLAKKSRYSEYTIMRLREGYDPLTFTAISRISTGLQKPPSELFGPDYAHLYPEEN